MKIKAKSKLVMIGDSITDCGRIRPVGEGLYGQLGDGYVNLVQSFLGAAHPAEAVQVLNVGISGNTVRDLKGRWQSDVLDLKPDWLSIMIGTNDVWRQFDSADNPEIQVHPEEFEKTLHELIHTTLPSLQGLVLLTPFLIETNRQDPMRSRMDEYGEIVRQLAKRHETAFVDTQAAYDAVLRHAPAENFSNDRVHPNSTGHMVLARAFLKAIDFE